MRAEATERLSAASAFTAQAGSSERRRPRLRLFRLGLSLKGWLPSPNNAHFLSQSHSPSQGWIPHCQHITPWPHIQHSRSPPRKFGAGFLLEAGREHCQLTRCRAATLCHAPSGAEKPRPRCKEGSGDETVLWVSFSTAKQLRPPMSTDGWMNKQNVANP